MSPSTIFPDAEALAASAANRIAALAHEALAARGRFNLMLSGGRTPEALYRLLAAGVCEPSIDWAHVRVFFADERAVPLDDPASNFRLARATLLDAAGIPPRNVHRMKGEYPDLAVAADEYEAHLREAMDVIVLGIGEDGHTASLFPGSALVQERVRRVGVVLDAPKPPPRRLTVTRRVLEEARALLVLATGPDKSDAVARALAAEGSERETPARVARSGEWYLDPAAARPAPGGR